MDIDGFDNHHAEQQASKACGRAAVMQIELGNAFHSIPCRSINLFGQDPVLLKLGYVKTLE
jgi:hypothetical protein